MTHTAVRAPMERIHARYVAGRRLRCLAALLAPLLPPGARVLDVGCGDGALAAQLQRERPDLAIEGVDILVRPATAIPVRPYDGRVLPYASAGVDAVLLVDTVHHAADPLALLREAVRVAGRSVVLKDHTAEGWLARPILRFMDEIGNVRHGVAVPGTYWRKAEWLEAFRSLGVIPAVWQSRLRLYPWPASWVFDRSLHFIARLDRARPAGQE